MVGDLGEAEKLKLQKFKMEQDMQNKELVYVANEIRIKEQFEQDRRFLQEKKKKEMDELELEKTHLEQELMYYYI